MEILQVGLGNFGRRHVEAWHRLGFGDQLWIAEEHEEKWDETARYRFPKARLVRAMESVLDQVQVVDLVTPTDSHFALARAALEAGKDVFIEKPMTATSAEARAIAELAHRLGRLVQVGYYYRFHPAAQRLKQELAAGWLGKPRYVSGTFAGFKRARTDIGVTHTDGIHFLDLINWWLESQPEQVYAICRDHFGRGLEDFSIVLLTYPGGLVGKVESNYIQPGRWKDKVVAGAMTTKEIMVVGDRAAAAIDFETETLTLHDAHHELRHGIWTAVVGGVEQLPTASCEPVDMVVRELDTFVQAVRTRQLSGPGPVDAGVNLACVMDAIYESARRGEAVRIEAGAVAHAT